MNWNEAKNTPYYNLPWYWKIVLAPMVKGLKVVNWIVRKILY